MRQARVTGLTYAIRWTELFVLAHVALATLFFDPGPMLLVEVVLGVVLMACRKQLEAAACESSA